MKVLVLRAIEDAGRTAARLAERGHEAILSPVLGFRSLDNAIPEESFDALIATSAHAFPGRAPDALAAAPLFLVGEKTFEAARRAGFGGAAEVAPNAAMLIERMLGNVPAGARALYLAGRDRKPEIEHALSGRHDPRIVETYAAERANSFAPQALAAMRTAEIDAALHYSRRSAQIFCDLVSGNALAAGARRMRHIAISPDAATPLTEAGLVVEVADAPDESAMLGILENGRKQ